MVGIILVLGVLAENVFFLAQLSRRRWNLPIWGSTPDPRFKICLDLFIQFKLIAVSRRGGRGVCGSGGAVVGVVDCSLINWLWCMPSWKLDDLIRDNCFHFVYLWWGSHAGDITHDVTQSQMDTFQLACQHIPNIYSWFQYNKLDPRGFLDEESCRLQYRAGVRSHPQLILPPWHVPLPNLQLVETQNQPTNTVAKINVLKAVFVGVKKRWSKLKDYVIGYIIWAPPIGVDIPPTATQGTCVSYSLSSGSSMEMS